MTSKRSSAIWLDNTGFQSVGKCLNRGGANRNEDPTTIHDVIDFVRFCGYSMLFQRLTVSPYVPTWTIDRTLGYLESSDLRSKCSSFLEIPEIDHAVWKECFEVSMAKFAANYPDARTAKNLPIRLVGRSAHYLPQLDAKKTYEVAGQLYEFITKKTVPKTSKGKEWLDQDGGAVAALEQHSSFADSIREAFKDGWSLRDGMDFIFKQRIYLNDVLAAKYCSIYSPATKRAEVLDQQNRAIISEGFIGSFDEAQHLYAICKELVASQWGHPVESISGLMPFKRLIVMSQGDRIQLLERACQWRAENSDLFPGSGNHTAASLERMRSETTTDAIADSAGEGAAVVPVAAIPGSTSPGNLPPCSNWAFLVNTRLTENLAAYSLSNQGFGRIYYRLCVDCGVPEAECKDFFGDLSDRSNQ